jgi:hypothetical protein
MLEMRACLPIILSLTTAFGAEPADVVVASETPAGVVAAVAAARRGEGDLAAFAGVPYRVGFDGRSELEPVLLARGEASGTSVRAVDVKSVQRGIVKRGGAILHENTSIAPEEPEP